MAPVDANAPVIVGAGQLTPADRAAPTSPLALLTEAARRALADTTAQVTGRIEAVGVTNCLSWTAPDPGRALAAELGISPATTVTTRTSGTSPLELLRDACVRIRRGELRMVLLAGAEAVKALNEGRYPGGPEQPPGTAPSRVLGVDRMPSHPVEQAAGLYQPVQFYALFENALRAAAGRDPASHLAWLGRLWAAFGEVASANPHAWASSTPTAESLVDFTRTNRPVAHPYPKLMTANLGVDQAAALVLCSARAARDAGIPRDRWVFVHGTAAANDHWHVGEREHLHRSPAIRAVGRALLEQVRLDITELDLYSCFPSSVQVAAAELGVELADPPVAPTVTGGLTFAGGPGSNYVTHALATLVGRLREDRLGAALCTGVGWFLTKHAAAVLSCRPPAGGFTDANPQSEVDALPRRAVVPAEGSATVETYTVTYHHDGTPATGYIAALTDDGRRTYAASADADQAAGLLDGDPIGTRVRLSGTTFS